MPDDVRRGDPDAEHTVLMDDFEVCLAAEAAGLKYIWISEHHFLDEYSHISANDVFLGALASRTTRAHLGSGIFNPLPKVNHLAKVAERVAMLDHLTEGRFEFGTGRGAGSHEVTGFLDELAGTDVSETKAIWEETIAEFPKMWMQDTYEASTASTSRCRRARCCPSRIRSRTRRCGTPPGTRRASRWRRASVKGLGILGFSLDHLYVTEKAVQAYKKAIVDAEPVGAFVDDNILVAGRAVPADRAGPVRAPGRHRCAFALLRRLTLRCVAAFGGPITDSERERFGWLCDIQLEEWAGDGQFRDLVDPDLVAPPADHACRLLLGPCVSGTRLDRSQPTRAGHGGVGRDQPLAERKVGPPPPAGGRAVRLPSGGQGTAFRLWWTTR